MGISCSVLFRKASYNHASDLYKVVEKICNNNSFFYKIAYKEEDENGEIKKIYFNVSDKPLANNILRQLSISIFDEPYKYKEISFEWHKEEVFFEAIVIDFVEDNEDLLLQVFCEFLQEYREAVLWMEENWFYFYEDIISIKQKEFDPNWCYKNPHL